jgi:hypothetical protein
MPKHIKQRLAEERSRFHIAFDKWINEQLNANGYTNFTIVNEDNPRDYCIEFDCPKMQFLYLLRHGSNSLSDYWAQWLDMNSIEHFRYLYETTFVTPPKSE